MSDSAFDHEREALAFLRRALPDRDPTRVWSNFEFVAGNGAMYEVDALVVSDAGVFLVEIKSHPGAIGGDAGTWQWTPPDGGRIRTFDNPRSLANRKAKHLAGLLVRTRAWQSFRKTHPARDPYVQEVVFLSDPHLRVSLSPPGRYEVFGRDPADGEEVPAGRRSLTGIVARLTSLEPGRDGRPVRRVDRPMGEALAKAVDELGIRERTARRRVGDYRLAELLDDVEADRDTGVAYQDFAGVHVALPDVRQRVRIYAIEHNPTGELREAAERAARREFLLLHPLEHPGIVRPVAYTESERGPALVFDLDPDERPLHRWLADPAIGPRLSVQDRLGVVREIAEAVQYAHQRGVAHRALSPSAVLVRGGVSDFRVRVANWHAGARVATGSVSASGTVGTAHLDSLARDDAALYRAPEGNQPRAKATLLDVFSLGALTCLVLTGQPPAQTPTALIRMVTQHGCVPVDAIDELDAELAQVVAEATRWNPKDRIPSVQEFLQYLDIAEEHWGLADAPTEPHPDEARRGDRIGDSRFEVVHRLGSGSTSFALEVLDHATDPPRRSVLKVAGDTAHNARLATEAGAIGQLDHPSIVKLLDGPLDLSGHTALLLTHAGPTLATRVAEPPGAELAERFGEDLLGAVAHLEEMGVSHRDIKPDNIGIAPRGKNEERHAVLFDFSLTDAPIDRVEAGTQGYLDPFLRLPGRAKWDLHAERYAAAVTLFELVTGTRPRYGDGTADPASIPDGPAVDRSLFDPAIAGGLTAFFERALARDAKARFDTAQDMLRAWRRAFEPAAQPATPTIHPPASDDHDPAEAEGLTVPPGTTAATPLARLALSNRAVNALERQEVLTVGDLLAFPLSRLPRITGVGPKTRREIGEAVAVLRDAVDTAAQPAAATGGLDDPSGSLSELAARLLADLPGARPSATLRTVARGVLGVDDPPGARWPTHAELAERAKVTSARVSQIATKLKAAWAASDAIAEVITWLPAELYAAGGIAATVELAERFALSRPDPTTADDDHVRAARALVRAGLAVEDLHEQPRWVLRRQGDAMLAALNVAAVVVPEIPPGDDDRTGTVPEPVDPPQGQGLADYAVALTVAAEQLVADQHVVPRWALLDALHTIEAPPGIVPLDDARLVELVTGLSTVAAVNARLELYRRGLPAVEALRASRRSFVAAKDLTPAALAGKVNARYPDAEPFPHDPVEQRRLLAEVGVDLRWDDTTGTYDAPLASPAETSVDSTLHRRASRHAAAPIDPVALDEATEFEARLLASRDHGGVLVLCADPRFLPDAAAALEPLATATVDLDDRILDRIRAMTAAGKPSWDTIVAADAAGPTGKQWPALTKVVDRALDELTTSLLATPGAVLVHQLGLLARYDRLHRIAEWREALHDRAGAATALWVLVGTSAANDRPMLDGMAVPVLSRNEWTRVPNTWIVTRLRALEPSS